MFELFGIPLDGLFKLHNPLSHLANFRLVRRRFRPSCACTTVLGRVLGARISSCATAF